MSSGGGGPILRGLEIHVLTSLEEAEACVPAWHALAVACEATVFQSPAWALAWWRVFGAGSRLRLVAVQSEGQLVGLAPFHVKATRAGVRRLETLGSPEADYGGLLAARGAEAAVGQALADWLLEDRPWDVLWLPEVRQECWTTTYLVDALRARGCRVHQRATWCHRIPLPGSWEEYYSRLGRSTRKRLSQKDRRWAESGAQAQRMRGREGMAAFVALHTEQWRRRGRGGAFADHRSARFHTAVAAELERLGCLDLWALVLNGTPQAAVYDVRFGRSVYSYLCAVNPDGLLRLSPGMVLTLWRIRAAIEDGYAYYDLLRGDEAYKRALGARPFQNTSYLVAHPRRWRSWWYLALGPLREVLLRREQLRPTSAGPPRSPQAMEDPAGGG